MGSPVTLHSTQQFASAADAFIEVLSAQLPGQRFDEFFHANTLRSAYWSALERALDQYADPGRVPLARSLLRGHILADAQVIDELLKLFLPGHLPDYQAVARRWAEALGPDDAGDLVVLGHEAERVFALLAEELRQASELRLALQQVAQLRLNPPRTWEDAQNTAEQDLSRLLEAALVTGPNTLGLQVRHLLALASGREPGPDALPALALEALVRLASHLDAGMLRALWAALPACDACDDPALALRLRAHIAPYAARIGLLEDPLAYVQALITQASGQIEPAVCAEVLIALAPQLEASTSEVFTLFAQRVLEGVSAIGDPASRVRALGALIPYLPAPLQPQAVTLAFEIAAIGIASEAARVEVLSGLLPYLPPEFQDRLLGLAASVGTLEARALLLGRMLRYLPPSLQAQALTGALNAIAQIPQDEARTRALIALAADIDAVGSLLYLPDELRQAMVVTFSIEHAGERARAFAALAPYLSPELLGEALHTTRDIPDELERASTLTWLAPRLPSDLQVAAFGIAQELRPAQARATALAAIAPYLSPTARHTALADALAAALAIEERYDRVVALVDLAPHLADDLRGRALLEALIAARSIPAESARARALVFLAPHLLEQHLPDALADAYTILDPLERTPALSALLPHLPPEPRLRVGHDLIATARQADQPEVTARILAAIAPVLPAKLIPEAVSAAGQITAPAERMHVLAALLPRDPARLYAPALGTARAIANPYQRATALLELVPYTSPPARHPLLEQALATALAIDDDYDRAGALAALAPYLTPQAEAQHHQQDALRLALAACLAVPDPASRARLLGQLAPVWNALLTPAQAYALWGDVVAFLKGQPAAYVLSDLAALAPVIEHMGAPQAVQALVQGLSAGLALDG